MPPPPSPRQVLPLLPSHARLLLERPPQPRTGGR
jgi:hypothetical protein